MSISIVHGLRKARGTNKKLQILKKHKDNDQWKRILEAMYDTGVNYHVSSPSENTFLEDHEVDYDDMLEALSTLASRKYTGNKARDFAVACSEQYGEMFRLVLGGSLKAGVSTTTINKAYPELIPTYPLMLAKDVEIKEYPIWGSTKFDGVRLIAKNYGDKVVIITRQGKHFPLEELEKEIAKLHPGVYDGELVVGDGMQAGRTKITGYVNKVLLGKAKTLPEYTFCIFDYIPIQDWENQKSTFVYGTRYQTLVEQFPKYKQGNLRIVQQECLRNNSEVEHFFNNRLVFGFEGIILRYKASHYQWKRTPDLIKKKAIKDCKLTCVGTNEGTGKYEGLIGALVCVGRVEGKPVRVKIGSGLTDTDRQEPEAHFIGNTIDIEYNDVVTQEKSDTYSLFLPRFKRVLK